MDIKKNFLAYSRKDKRHIRMETLRLVYMLRFLYNFSLRSRKAGFTLAVMCVLLTEHTFVKLEIKSVTDKIFTWHSP